MHLKINPDYLNMSGVEENEEVKSPEDSEEVSSRDDKKQSEGSDGGEKENNKDGGQGSDEEEIKEEKEEVKSPEDSEASSRETKKQSESSDGGEKEKNEDRGHGSDEKENNEGSEVNIEDKSEGTKEEDHRISDVQVCGESTKDRESDEVQLMTTESVSKVQLLKESESEVHVVKADNGDIQLVKEGERKSGAGVTEEVHMESDAGVTEEVHMESGAGVTEEVHMESGADVTEKVHMESGAGVTEEVHMESDDSRDKPVEEVKPIEEVSSGVEQMETEDISMDGTPMEDKPKDIIEHDVEEISQDSIPEEKGKEETTSEVQQDVEDISQDSIPEERSKGSPLGITEEKAKSSPSDTKSESKKSRETKSRDKEGKRSRDKDDSDEKSKRSREEDRSSRSSDRDDEDKYRSKSSRWGHKSPPRRRHSSSSSSSEKHKSSKKSRSEDVDKEREEKHADSKEERSSSKKKSTESRKRKLSETEDSYDPSSPTSEPEEPPLKKSSSALDKVKSKPRKLLPELDKYWKAVKEEPADFTAWTYLLQYVDQENDVDAAREAYDAFLSLYPYCYGYWRKYADYEKRRGDKEKCEEVFERGLKAIPLSVDLWIHFLNHCKSVYTNEDHLRKQFERAIEACGLEFRSDRLWELYVKWETENKNLQNVTVIYDRILKIPTQGYASHIDNFEEFVRNHSPQQILPVDEFLAVRREVSSSTQFESGTGDVPPGLDEVPPGEEEDAKIKSEEEIAPIREKIIEDRRKIHKETTDAVAVRWTFEEGIKRPYFHVKPLERCQLKNWKEYLDFEVEQGNTERTIVLFERCLIACALYEEFWLRFVEYLQSIEKKDVKDKIINVFTRACTIHHTKKPSLHLQWAAFEEMQENWDKAAEILSKLDETLPNLLQVCYRRINLERRRGDSEKVCELYEQYITNSKNLAIASNLSVKYARYCWKMLNDIEKAEGVLRKALESDKNNPRLYLQLVDLGLQRTPINENAVSSVFDEFLACEEVDPEQKVMFAQRKMEFLEDFGSNIMSVQRAYDEYQNFFKICKEKTTLPVEGGSEIKIVEGQREKKKVADASTSQYQYKQTDYTDSSQYSQAYASQYPQSYSQQYSQPYSQSTTDTTNYANYQNWNYSQTGYGYNQNWSGYNNYY